MAINNCKPLISDIVKLELYTMLNSIQIPKYKKNTPYNFIKPNITLTYDTIKLDYIDGKNYFVKVDKKMKFNNSSDRNGNSNRGNDRNGNSNRGNDRNRGMRGGDINMILVYS